MVPLQGSLPGSLTGGFCDLSHMAEGSGVSSSSIGLQKFFCFFFLGGVIRFIFYFSNGDAGH